MAVPDAVRIIVQVFAVIINLIGIGLITASILSTGWQIMIEPGTGEIHQHGLWADYIYSNRFHMAGAPAPGLNAGAYYNAPWSVMEGGSSYSHDAFGSGYYYGFNMAPGGQWIMTYKFGDAVYGDDVHRAQPFQIYCLILMVLALVFGAIAVMFSYCASAKPGLAVAWTALLLIGLILGASALIQFYIATMLPQYRFVFTDREIQQFVGYSFWWGCVGVIFLLVATLMSIIVGALIFTRERQSQRSDNVTYVFRNGNDRQGVGNPFQKAISMLPFRKDKNKAEKPVSVIPSGKEPPVSTISYTNGRESRPVTSGAPSYTNNQQAPTVPYGTGKPPQVTTVPYSVTGRQPTASAVPYTNGKPLPIPGPSYGARPPAYTATSVTHTEYASSIKRLTESPV